MSFKREIELKATVHPEHLDRLRNLSAVKKRGVGRTRSRKLATAYWDTPDVQLRQQGITLRVRKAGNAFVQCVKQGHSRIGGMMSRIEWEGPVPSEKPAVSVIENKSLRKRIRRARPETLLPVFQTEFHRSSRKLKFDDGSVATLDIDHGRLIVGEASEPICEFELELESGNPERIFDLASEIRKVVPFRLTTTSKATRGYALLTADSFGAQKYVGPSLAQEETIEDALSKIVQHSLDHLQANELFTLKTEDPEGVHQMRVALRRMRSALDLFKAHLPVDQYERLATEARWMNGELSAARAWDVFAEEFVPPVARLSDDGQAFDALQTDLDRIRSQCRERARTAIKSERYAQFLLELGTWLYSRAWRDQPVSRSSAQLLDPIGAHSGRLLKKQNKRVRKRSQNIEKLNEADLHRLRIAVKKLRYATDALEALYPNKRTKAFKKRLSALQDRLGYINDVAAAEELVRELGAGELEVTPPAITYACGLVMGWHRDAALRAKSELISDVNAFLRTRPFW